MATDIPRVPTLVFVEPLPDVMPVTASTATAPAVAVSASAAAPTFPPTPSSSSHHVDGSFIDDEGPENQDLSAFLAPVATSTPTSPEKGKGPAQVAASVSASAGPSNAADPSLAAHGYVSSTKPTTKSLNGNLEALAHMVLEQGKQLTQAKKDMADIASGVPPVQTTSNLAMEVEFVNNHNQLYDNMIKLHSSVVNTNTAVTTLADTVSSLAATVTAVAGKVESLTQLVLSLQVDSSAEVNGNGKRGRYDPFIPIAPITVPAPIVTAPVATAPAIAAPAAPVPAPAAFVAPPVFVPPVFGTTSQMPMPAAFTFPPIAAAPTAAPAVAFAPSSMAPPGPMLPPRSLPDPRRQVVVGPYDFQNNHTTNVRTLLHAVLGAPLLRSTRFFSRRGQSAYYAVVVFEAPDVADWFTTTWNSHPRTGMEYCQASAFNPSLNA